jgi:hypothetical protein
MSLQFQTEYELLPKIEFELSDGLFVNGKRIKKGTIRKPMTMDNRLADAAPNPDGLRVVRDAFYYARLVRFDDLERETSSEMLLNLSEQDFIQITELTATASKLPLVD